MNEILSNDAVQRTAPKVRKRSVDIFACDCATGCAVLGDWLIAFASLWLAYTASFTGYANMPHMQSAGSYSAFGAFTLIAVLSATGIYNRRNLLHLRKIFSRLSGGLIWFLFFVYFTLLLGGVSVHTLKFACGAIALGAPALASWRLLLHRIVSDERIAAHMRQRILLIGWTPEVGRLSQSIWRNRTDNYEIVGYLELSGNISEFAAPPNIPFLGAIDDLTRVLQDHDINVAWLSDVNADGSRIPHLAAQCEREMVEFKIIPSYFPILISAMHLETVCGTPILGIDHVPLNLFHLRILKRLMDIAGAVIGLILTAPIIAVFCAIVYAESPGPVFYFQTRIGRKGSPFKIIKIRSMRLDAEKAGAPGWTTKNDPRRLRIGSLMRRLNIDELPQFWNVLTGQMSLVGPRPERPELIQNFKHEIKHYNARHVVKPGVTGWAQVNGLRGDTDLSERIRYDIYYMEHWNLFFDLQIIFLTFFRHANAC